MVLFRGKPDSRKRLESRIISPIFIFVFILTGFEASPFSLPIEKKLRSLKSF
jgi:hypothetical protein